MFKELDPLLHSQLRLAIMSILLSVEEAEFVYIKEKTNATAGNLSVQLDKLNEAGYIEIEKGFAGKKPRTVCRITDKGRLAMEEYVNTLRQYINILLVPFLGHAYATVMAQLCHWDGTAVPRLWKVVAQ